MKICSVEILTPFAEPMFRTSVVVGNSHPFICHPPTGDQAEPRKSLRPYLQVRNEWLSKK